MKLHLRPVPTKYSFALEQARSETHRKLKHEMEEKKISAELVATHNERVRQRRSTPHWIRD